MTLTNEQIIADRANRERGSLTDYDCPACLNRGYFLAIDELGNRRITECKCMVIRKNKRRLKLSGLSEMAERYTFDNWQAKEPWQERAAELVKQYADNAAGWLLVSGSVGAGKTHLCTAVCVKLINDGVDTRYMLWRDVVTRAKALINDGEAYKRLVEPLKTVKALYIDDFFKTGKGAEPTEADVNFAFELLNARYCDAGKLTIISTERTPKELLGIDEAVGSRILERSRSYTLRLQGKRNWRLG